MDGIRLVAIAEPSAGTGSAGSAGPSDPRSPRAATGSGGGGQAGCRIAGGMAAASAAKRDALDCVLASSLDRACAAVRWGIGAGRDDASAATRAVSALELARERGIDVGFATGDPWRDALLADLELALAALLDDLTPRQAEIARLILVDGARQVEVALALDVSRATVSVAVARGRLSAIAGVRRAIEAVLAGPPAAAAARGASDAVPARSAARPPAARPR